MINFSTVERRPPVDIEAEPSGRSDAGRAAVPQARVVEPAPGHRGLDLDSGHRRCDQCGLAAGDVDPADFAERAFIAAEEWVQILRSESRGLGTPAARCLVTPGVRRPCPRRLSLLFDARLAQMLSEDIADLRQLEPGRDSHQERYGEQDPEVVAGRAEAHARALRCVRIPVAQAGVSTPTRDTGSDGAEFTVVTRSSSTSCTMSIHHLWDVTGQQDAAASLALGVIDPCDGTRPSASVS